MDFEFDKEMDALLRQATRSGEVTSNTDLDSHLDADEISIFAENALPENAKARVTKHLADCDRCRTILTNTITLNSEAANESASAAVPARETEVASEAAEPWYRKLFATQNLVYGLGALALVFAGMLGFLVVQNAFGPGSSEVAQETASSDSAANRSTNFEGDTTLAEPENANSNLTAEIPAADSNLSRTDTVGDAKGGGDPNVAVPNGPRTVDSDSVGMDNRPGYRDRGRRQADLKDKVTTGEENDVLKKRSDDPVDKEVSEAESAQKMSQNKRENRYGEVERNRPPPPAPTETKTSRRMMKPKPQRTPSRKADRAATLGAARTEEKAAKRKEKNVPSTVTADRSDDSVPSTTKTINGKTFQRRNGVWYDDQYNRQKTKNIRKSSSEYRKLDSGLRTIVGKLGGTVVIVWKSKAYRIQ
ncbi:MAG: zf-HC2 domain-containing protein [Pyrinomonadaceae bacterium]|nr:zf-HC2 domain-containing protein [Pyrinomonadaceae bacterium]